MLFRSLEIQSLELALQIEEQNEIITEYKNEIIELNKSFGKTNFKLFNKETRESLGYYYLKYPFAKVTYAGRNPPNTTKYNYTMYVENWAQYGIDSPEIKKIIAKAKCDVITIMSQNKIDFHKACDIAIQRAKTYVGKYAPYKYTFDKTSTGNTEYWKFALETWISSHKYQIGSDCDDWAILMHVIWVASGIPAEALRVVGGISRGGIGHATNHYYASDGKWHHINSTTSYSNGFVVLNTPLHDDPKDFMGIARVWFSFNNQRAWSKGNTNYLKKLVPIGLDDKFKPQMVFGSKIKLIG